MSFKPSRRRLAGKMAVDWIISSLTPAPASKSILPFIPRPLKYLCLLVLLVNFRSWPLFWHLRVFSPFFQIRLTQLWHIITFKSKQRKLNYLRSLSPVGEHPLRKRVKWSSWASPDDSDYNMHLSNSSYPKRLDSARFKTALEYFSPFLADGGNILLGGTHFNFLREIPINSPYEIRMRLACWDQKWMYIVGQYVIPRKGSIASKQSARELAEGVKRAFDKKDAELSSPAFPNLTGTPSTPFASTTPNGSGTDSRTNRQLTTLGDGSTLACTSVSLLCCKYGRSTVPPALALAVSGFLMDEDEWKIVRQMRGKEGKDGMNQIKELLKGHWRDVVAAEKEKLPEDVKDFVVGEGAWWDRLMNRQGVQQEVDEALKTLGKLKESMDGIAKMCLASE